MASVAKLRIINSIGSFISVIYGILIHAYPTVVMNGCLFLINCFYLIRMFNHKEVFKVVKSDISDISYKYFFDNNKTDILSFFPDIEKNMTNSNYARISLSGNEIEDVF